MQTASVRIRPNSGVKRTQHQTSQYAWPGSSNPRTFLRSLRLLDLDLKEDWPDLAEEHFNLRNAQQTLQQRVKGVEWCLYRLFELWDPEETKNKLRPFFPPLTHLQSVNLRAALFRALSDLKKNGMLGKETMLRKTMLDDCRGDKLEEILAKFALMVLRKFGKEFAPLNASHIVFDREQSSDRATLVSLIIAHQKGLKGLLASRNAEAQKYAQIQQALEIQTERLKATDEKKILRRHSSYEDIRGRAEDARQRLEQAWNGDDSWADVLVNGGSENVKPALSQTTFEEVWRSAQNGNALAIDTASSTNLLDDLTNRIAGQEKRIENWKAFKARFSIQSNEVGKGVGSSVKAQTHDMFQSHEALRFEPQNIQKSSAPLTSSFNNPCADLLEQMHSSLAALKHDKSRTSTSQEDTEENDTRLAKRPIKNDKVFSWNSDQAKPEIRLPIDNFRSSLENRELVAKSKKPSATTRNRERPRRSVDTQSMLSKSPPKVKAEKSKREISPPHRQRSGNLQTKSTGYSPVRALSPLAEDRKPIPEPGSDPPSSPDLPSPPAPAPLDPPSQRATTTTTTIPVSNLIERTRQSMSLLPNYNPNPSHHPAKQARKSTHHPRPSQSFPINPFQTPPPPAAKASAAASMPLSPRLDSGSSTPRDSLFSEEADYASVFKSRPRVAMSPRESLSPMRNVYEGEEEVRNEGNGEGGEEEDDEGENEMSGWSIGSSPLRPRS
ncbi:MAG: hypothetical protein Q9160_005718 [Pyrenula sp. 1 TL-2023]